MAVTEEDLQKQREKLDTLRSKITDTTSQREERERDLSNEIMMKQMQAEEARLNGELNLAKEMAKAGTVKAGTADLLDTVAERQSLADEQAKAVAKSTEKE